MTRRKMIWLIGFVLVCAAEHHPLTVQAESNQVLRDAYTSYIRDTLIHLYGVLETDTAECIQVQSILNLGNLTKKEA